MQSVLLSTAYFPPVYYFYQIIHSSRVIIEKEENFLKQTYRNRCVILGANGPLNLSVPLQHGPDPKTNIREIKISYHTNWQAIHFRAIESAYRKTPFYEFYVDDFIVFFQEKYETLFELNSRILAICLDLTGYKGNVEETSYYQEPFETDLRYSISPKKLLLNVNFPPYHQVFMEKFGFTPNLSILDLLFNTGPDAGHILKGITLNQCT